MRLLIALMVVVPLASSVVHSQEVVTHAAFDELMTELSNWGRWGPDDTKGTVNLITPEKRIEAAGLVRSGVSVSLARELDHVEAPDNPYPLDQEVYATGQAPSARIAGDRLAVRFHGLAHTHLDALCHFFYQGQMYNGFPQALVTDAGCQRLSIRSIGDGLLTRGVLIDIAWLKGLPFLEPDTAILPSDLDQWTDRTGLEIRAGDVVLLRTGRWARRAENGAWNAYESLAGLDTASVRWLRERDVSAVGTDAAVDILPSSVEGEEFPAHALLIVAMGTPIFDNLDLEALSEEAQRQGRWEFLFTAAPLAVPGGTGSPLNPIATF